MHKQVFKQSRLAGKWSKPTLSLSTNYRKWLNGAMSLFLTTRLMAFGVPMPEINLTGIISDLHWKLFGGAVLREPFQESQEARNATVERLEVFPAQVRAQVGQSIHLIAIPRDANDAPVPGVPV